MKTSRSRHAVGEKGIVPLVFALIIAVSVLGAGALIAYHPEISCQVYTR